MSGKNETIRKHMLGQVTLNPQFSIVCDECGFKAGSWGEFGAHVDALLSLPHHSKQEAIMSVLADHLGDLEGGYDDELAPHVDDHGRIHCGCGWGAKEPVDNDEFRAHLADEILTELDKVQEAEQ